MDRGWLARPASAVAPELLGCLLHAPADGVVVRLVEVEAYEQSEPAAHTFRGRTPGNAVMWGPAGHLYTYFTYGMHWCANVVTGLEGEGQAVLLRAAEPVEGVPALRARRPTGSDRDLLRGPARLAQALGLGRAQRGLDLLAPGGPLRLLQADRPPARVACGPRVGVRLAADLPWRFWEDGNPLVSRYTRHPKAPPA